MVSRHFRQLFPHDIDIVFRGYNPHSGNAGDRAEALHGELQKRFSHAEQIDELLRHFRRAYGPQTASDATGHNYDIGMLTAFHDKTFLIRPKFNENNLVNKKGLSNVSPGYFFCPGYGTTMQRLVHSS